ncbi:MAG: hypothetical protein V3T31_03590 [candidate division Zixibacteria bacterium]
MDHILLSMPTDPDVHTTIDSVLSRGRPIPWQQTEDPHKSVVVPFRKPLPRNDHAFLLISFRTSFEQKPNRDHLSLLLNQWFPMMERFDKESLSVNEPAAFRISLSVDSSMRAFAPGELLNEKEMYGLMPENEGVFIDLTASPKAADNLTPYSPVFEDGIRRYLFDSRYSTAVPLFISESVRLDRVIGNGLTISFYASSDQSARSLDRASEFIAELVKMQTEQYGLSRLESYTVVLSDQGQYFAAPGITIIPPGLTDDRLLPVALALGLATHWFFKSADRGSEEHVHFNTLIRDCVQGNMASLFGDKSDELIRAFFQAASGQSTHKNASIRMKRSNFGRATQDPTVDTRLARWLKTVLLN